MGWYGTTLGKYSLFIHDSVYNYVRQNKPLSYYENHKVEADFYIGDKKEEIELSLMLLGTPKLMRKNYRFDFDINTRKILYEEIKRRGLILDGYCFVDVRVSYNFDIPVQESWKMYYLKTPLMQEPISLSDIPNSERVIISSLEELDWLAKNGISFKYNTQH